IGVDQNTGVFGNYAYRIKMKKSSLSFGVAGGIMMVKSNGSKLNVNDTGHQLLADSPLGIMPDVSFGLSLNGEKYFVSCSIPMFLSHKFDGNKIRLYNDFSSYDFMLSGGVAIKMGESRKLKPSVLLKYKP